MVIQPMIQSVRPLQRDPHRDFEVEQEQIVEREFSPAIVHGEEDGAIRMEEETGLLEILDAAAAAPSYSPISNPEDQAASPQPSIHLSIDASSIEGAMDDSSIRLTTDNAPRPPPPFSPPAPISESLDTPRPSFSPPIIPGSPSPSPPLPPMRPVQGHRVDPPGPEGPFNFIIPVSPPAPIAPSADNDGLGELFYLKIKFVRGLRLEMSDRSGLLVLIANLESIYYSIRPKSYLPMKNMFAMFSSGFHLTPNNDSFFQLRYNSREQQHYSVYKKALTPIFNVIIFHKTDDGAERMARHLRKKFQDLKMENGLFILTHSFDERDVNASFIYCCYLFVETLKNNCPLAVRNAIVQKRISFFDIKKAIIKYLA